MTGFHFPPETRAFLAGLAANNRKDWFEAHRAAYERDWRAPQRAAGDVLLAEVGRLTGRRHRAKLFRIFNDVRFARGRPPYKTNLAMLFDEIAAPGFGPACYLSLEIDRLVVGCGVPVLMDDALDRWRAAVAGPRGAVLADLLAEVQAAGATLWPPEMKRLPRGFPADHPRADLLRHKRLIVTLPDLPPAVAEGPAFVAAVTAGFARVSPVVDWLRG
jgi:uncharacterized protein (TIGR02453 family)